MEESFIRNRNITYDSCFLFSVRKQKAEAIEIFHGRFNEQFKKCRLGDEDELITKDIFFTKWSKKNYCFAKQLLRTKH